MAEKIKETKGKQMWKKTVRFFKEVRTELRKVVWLTRKQLANSLIAILAICLLFGIVIWVADIGLSKIVDITLK
ncbi:MAG TPA: preprotein translocase subunit SecE [Clostridiales bacterium]|nr:preprotein translocase subunit SecE [Clostridiales bacterium]